jgi:hypothetical protein
MLAIDIKAATATDLRQLSPGQLFFYQKDEEHVLAVALAQEGKFAPWLSLSGESAFQLDNLEQSHSRLRVLALGIDANELTLKIDENSVASKDSKYAVGQLIFPIEGGVAIAAEWPQHREKNYENVVKINGWQYSASEPAGFRVSTWSLCYPDGSGKWVDVVSHTSKQAGAVVAPQS